MTLPLPSSPHWPPTRMMTTGLFGSRLGPPSLQVVEAGVVAPELELDRAGGTIAVLGDVNLGYSRLLVRFIVLWPIKKHYNVTILFDAAAFAKVAQNWALVGTLLGRPAQLGDSYHRHAQLTG